MGRYIAITGGIGSGKTTATRIIESMGYPVFSCDEIYKEILQEEDYVRAVEKVFHGVVQEGVIDKRALGEIVFSDNVARKKLEGLAHPRIMQRLLENMKKCTSSYVFAEVPLLFEGKLDALFDDILVVMRNRNDRVDAICYRDGIAEETALQKIATQFDYDNLNNLSKLKGDKITLLFNDKGIEDLKNELKNYIVDIQKKYNVKQYS